MTITSKEPTVNKSAVAFTSLKKQAGAGLYFESTLLYGRMRDDHAEVQLQNLALFAAGRYLFTKRNTARVEIRDTAKVTSLTNQSNFRNTAKSHGTEITEAEAFLTIMAAWEFATQRPRIAQIEVAGSRSNERLTVAAHALVNEPFAYPISESEMAALKSGDTTLARRLARNAESIWLGLAVAPVWSDGTPGHRTPGGLRNEKLAPNSLLANLSAEVAKEPGAFPKWTPATNGSTSLPTAALSEFLQHTAQNRLSWD